MNTKLNSTTATAGDILSGKTAYSRGILVTGTMANKGAVSATINSGESYTIPEGYHNGSGKVNVSEQNTVVVFSSIKRCIWLKTVPLRVSYIEN